MRSSEAMRLPSRLFLPNLAVRKARQVVFTACGVISILIGLGSLILLVVDIFANGWQWLDWQFLMSFDSRFAPRAGIQAALYGTVYMMFFTLIIALPIGVMSAIYLEEYASDNRLNRCIQINVSNLAGVPSIIYG